MCLTYDRPEMINKVVFKRRLSTGTWEVFLHPDSSRSPGQTTIKSSSSIALSRTSAVTKSSSNTSNRTLLSSPADFGISPSSTEHGESLEGEKQTTPVRQKFFKKSKANDPDYNPSSELGKKSKLSKPHKYTPVLGGLVSSESAPVISVQQPLPCNVPMTNHCSPGSENVSSRTRLKQVHSSPDLLSPSNQKSPNHRYPIRNKQ